MKRAEETELSAEKTFLSQLPENLNLGFVQAQRLHCHHLKLFNSSKRFPLSLTFSESIFVIQPSQLLIRPRETLQVVVHLFLPEAKIIVGKVEVGINGRLIKTVKISAIGKFPFLKIDRSLIDFGNANVGVVRKDWAELTNVSQVGVDFKIRRRVSEEQGKRQPMKSYISLKAKQGRLEPGERYRVHVQYCPKTFDQYDFCEYYVEVARRKLTEAEEEIKRVCLRRWAEKDEGSLKGSQSELELHPKEFFYDVEGVLDQSKLQEKGNNHLEL